MIENLDEIKTQLDPEQVLQLIGYLKTKPRNTGKELRASCPIHLSDKQQSLAIDTVTKRWNCFACGASGGDEISLYMAAKKIGDNRFDQAVKELASHFGIEIKYRAATKTEMPKRLRTPQQVLDESSPTGNHAYLKQKRVKPCDGLFFGKDKHGNDSIVVPFYTANGELQTVQFVHGGGKFFLEGEPMKGAFFPIGSLSDGDGDAIYLAEGVATALTIWMALNETAPVISFGSVGNMAHVATALREKHPDQRLIICCDLGPAPVKQAEKLSHMSSCTYRLPSFEGLTGDDLMDFNDLISKCDQPLTIVREQLAKELSYAELSTTQKNGQTEQEAPKADATPSLLTVGCQEDVVNYLLLNPLEQVIADEFNSNMFDSRLFTGVYRQAIDSIKELWADGTPVSATQLALNLGDSAPNAYEILQRIEEKRQLSASQITERLAHLKKEREGGALKKALVEALSSDKPSFEIISNLRDTMDNLHGTSRVMLPMSHYLPGILKRAAEESPFLFSTGFNSLDALFGGGFKKKKLYSIAGGAGAGKTSFALQVADYVAQNKGVVVYVTMEQDRDDLFERSQKRFEYIHRDTSLALAEYSKLSDYIYVEDGYQGMLVSEIRDMVLDTRNKQNTKDVLLVIDPFQRLGSGDEKVDDSNETLKVNKVCSQIKKMAMSLQIPILLLSDTVKGHESNASGEGVSRGSYMIDHTCDFVSMLKVPDSKDPLEALLGFNYAKNPNDGQKTEQEKLKKEIEAIAPLEDSYSDVYAGLIVPKNRDGQRFNGLFVYRKAAYLFEEVEIWKGKRYKGKE